MRSRRPWLSMTWILLALGLAIAGIPRPQGLMGPTGPTPEVGDAGRERWIVKLAEGRELVLDDQGRLFGESGVESGAWRRLEARLPGLEVRRLFPRPRTELQRDRRRGEERAGTPLRDLSLYARVTFPARSSVDLSRELVAALDDPTWLEAAYPEPSPEPAFLPPTTEDAGGGQGGGADGLAPDFVHGQGYLGPAPDGIGALAIHAYPGGKGRSVRIVDIEGDWNWEHHDLPSPFLREGTTIPAWRNHGTAVVGQLVGRDDGQGIVGICPEAGIGAVSFLDLGVAAAIDLAASSVEAGDIILIELHAPGPAEPEGPGQYGYLPMEWWQDCFDAIQMAVANGRIVVAAAGNGSQNLDHPRYLGLFDRNVRDSGAILVGAGTPFDHGAEWFTNRGSRIDLNGWGSAIITTGYGTLWEGAGEPQWYTAGFGGTSGAAPMVAGAIACLQSMSRYLFRVDLDPGLALELLRVSGTPCSPGADIGPRPDLVRAREELVTGVADYRGRVLGPGGSPVAAARVTVHPGTRTVRTDLDGAFRIPLRAGPAAAGDGADIRLAVHAAGFLPATFPVDVSAGEYRRQDLVLSEAPASRCHGRVVTADGVALEGAPVRAVSRSEGFSARTVLAETDADGVYEFASLPRNEDYVVVVGPVQGRSAAVHRLALSPDASPVIELPDLQVSPALTFEDGDDGWFSGSGGSGGSAGAGGVGWREELGGSGEFDRSSGAGWLGGFGESGWRSGSEGAFSGSRGWSVGSPYAANLDAAFESPPLLVPTNAWLSFHHRYDTESGYDGGRVEIEAGGDWIPLVPLGGYAAPNVAAFRWEAGYSGRSAGWEVGLVDLGPWGATEVRIRFRFASDESLSGTGWSIDDVAIVSFDQDASSVPEGTDAGGTEPGGTAAGGTDPGGTVAGETDADGTDPGGMVAGGPYTVRVRAWPNPFREQVRLEYPASGSAPATTVGGAGPASLAVYDAAGRSVRTLPIRNGVAVWEGRDDSGGEVPSGVYWILPVDFGGHDDGRGERRPEPTRVLRVR